MFQGSDVNITHAYDGKQALDMFDRCQFDVILMDCNMPVLSGHAATRIIREREQMTKHKNTRTAIIAHTANARPEFITTCTNAGMDEVLCKPCTRSCLLSRIVHYAQAGSSVVSLHHRHELKQVL
jgi:CheY-like chemotaxis protein